MRMKKKRKFKNIEQTMRIPGLSHFKVKKKMSRNTEVYQSFQLDKGLGA